MKKRKVRTTTAAAAATKKGDSTHMATMLRVDEVFIIECDNL